MSGLMIALPARVENVKRCLGLAMRAALPAVVALATGCATVPPNAGQDPRDPLESINRQVFEFNEGLDTVVLKPLAEVYVKVLPQPVQDCLSNGFSNLREPSNAINNLFQGKPAAAVNDVSRFAVNTTVGLLGCFDVARRMDLERSREDFGQTLAVWGVGNGLFLVLPLFGPSTVRDAVGIVGVETVFDVNFWIDNVSVRNSIFGTRLVNTRAELLRADEIISGAALDKYTFIRDGYLQRRRNLVYDGNPPREQDPDEEEAPPSGGAGKGSSGPPAEGADVKPSSAPKPAQ